MLTCFEIKKVDIAVNPSYEHHVHYFFFLAAFFATFLVAFFATFFAAFFAVFAIAIIV